MTEFSPGSALLGGALIGVSASLLWAFHGKVAGISGILSGLLRPGPSGFCSRADPRASTASDRGLRATFLLGLLLGGCLLLAIRPELIGSSPRPLALLFGAGLAVGVGTRVSGGCTSGHGVCGISRGAKRSFVATATFMLTGALSAFLVRLLFGASS